MGAASEGIRAAAAIGTKLAGAAGIAARAVLEQVGAAAASAVPESGLDVPDGLRDAAEAARGVAERGQAAVSGVAQVVGTSGRAAGAAAGSAARAAMRAALGDGPSNWRSVEAGKAAAAAAAGAFGELTETFQRESGATMEAARLQARRLVERAAGPNAAAAADELLRAVQESAEVAGKTATDLAGDAARSAAKEAAKGAVEGKD